MPRANVLPDQWIALLGRCDEPADGIEDYCAQLAPALAKHGVDLRVAHVEWRRGSWPSALRFLFRESTRWDGKWVILQYTALGWSRRGFPVGALISMAILRFHGARCAVMFHEPWGTSGPRLIDQIRCAFQNWTVRTLHRFSKRNIFSEPLDTISWQSAIPERSAFIPLGSNIPEYLTNRCATRNENGSRKTVVVFCVSEAPHYEREIADISHAARVAAAGGIRLRIDFVGRGTSEAEEEIGRAFRGTQIEVRNHGLCEAAEVTRIFGESDAMLAVRGRLYLRRGSALAGVACGLPIVGYEGAAQGTVLEEAGIALVPFGDREALGTALSRILVNPDLWKELHEKNLRLQKSYFSWDLIARSYVDFFKRSLP